MAYLWNTTPTPFFDSAGGFASGAKAYFYTGSSTTPLVVYSDPGLSYPLPYPVPASVAGVFPPVYVPYGTYSVKVNSCNGVLIYYAQEIDNPAPPSAGGGIVVTSDEILQTGDPIWRLTSGKISGFVRMNGNTLGSLSSGATEYAAANASNLFSFLWNLPNSIAPVSGGRGVSAAADFAANKNIVIPTMQGIIPAGVDDMGATAAGNIQAITTCTPTGASNIVPVASAANILVDQSVIINGVAVGTVTAISGLNITLSVTPAAGSSVAWRSSFFADAQQVGALGGGQDIIQTTDQLPPHSHPVNDTGHTHTTQFGGNSTGGPSLGGTLASSIVSNVTDSALTGITIANTGGGNPLSVIQPTRLGCFYIKL